MGKLTYCPYEVEPSGDRNFKKIDMDNLAYVFVFRFGHDYQELNSGILAGYLDDLVTIGSDERLKRYYNDDSVHYMLWEGLQVGRPNGMDQLLALIERENEAVLERTLGGLFEDIDDSDRLLSCSRQENGVYTISYADGSGTSAVPIADLFPCCPSCHHPLPLGWEKADAFLAISLLSLTGAGKSTFLSSMMANDWECLNLSGSDWIITSAHDVRIDEIYGSLEKAADDLYYKGVCPRNTPTGYLIAPVFLSVLYKKKYRIVVGIYDNAGEVLRAMESDDPRITVLPNMDAHIYLIEPKQMNLSLPQRDGGKKSRKKEYALLSIAAQADFQREHGHEMIRGRELLWEALQGSVAKKNRRDNPMRLYDALKKAMVITGQYEKLQNQHICCVVDKADQLEELPEFQNMPQREILFGREESFWNRDVMFIHQELIREKIFGKYVFMKEQQMENLKKDTSSVSWHCISALGCEPTETAPNEFSFDVEAYAPIRLAEPVMTCLMQKVEELGWAD